MTLRAGALQLRLATRVAGEGARDRLMVRSRFLHVGRARGDGYARRSAGGGGAEPGENPLAPLSLLEPGDHEVDASIVCVVTRFGLAKARYLLPTYLDYRRVVAAARRSKTPGLVRAAFLVESPTSCYSLSLWTDSTAIAHFGTNVGLHVEAARRIFGRLAFDPERGPELWSTKWRLASVSNNLNWQDFDLRKVLLQAGDRARAHGAS